MLATFIIGLREGLEAALIIGIIAAFLRKAGKSLVPMWTGVALAIMLSVAVGVTLKLIERELSQSKQEALETIIGAVAVVFVTGMIVWMNDHARGMKAALEHEAAHALGQGSARSLAIMAFLAVLKEGFETSVFLLATFSVAQSTKLAAMGALLGIATSAIIGFGIYVGGIKINLGKFFRYTGAFLIVVAAGLALSVVRTAHEAGWINAGQQKTFDLSWLVQPGTVQSALITGVLGIPADPRLIEVIAWFAYLIPVSLYVYWPAKWRPQGAAVPRFKFSLAGVLLAVALGLYIGYPSPTINAANKLDLVANDDQVTSIGTAQLVSDASGMSLQITENGQEPEIIRLDQPGATVDIHNGLEAEEWVISRTTEGETQSITLNELIELNGGRLPVGVNANRNPGPFTMTQSTVHSTTVWIYHGVLLDATDVSKSIIEISDGGLDYPRTINTSRDGTSGWAVAQEDRDSQAKAINDLDLSEAEHKLWARDLPILLSVIAIGFIVSGASSLAHLRRERKGQPDTHAPPVEPNALSV
ncbi:MAG: FTR1 family protein [Thermomicrobiales bacterium]|nr:FTR1 family protein [Thermomicrobiales bacterium]